MITFTLKDILLMGSPLFAVGGAYALTRWRLNKVEEKAEHLNQCKVDKELYEIERGHFGAALDRIETSVSNINQKMDDLGKETRSSISRVHERVDKLVKQNGGT